MGTGLEKISLGSGMEVNYNIRNPKFKNYLEGTIRSKGGGSDDLASHYVSYGLFTKNDS